MTENLRRLVVASLPRCEVRMTFCSGSKPQVLPRGFVGRLVRDRRRSEDAVQAPSPLGRPCSSAGPRSACLRHLYPRGLSVTPNTILSVSTSFSVFSDSQFHVFLPQLSHMLFCLLFLLVVVRPALISFSILGWVGWLVAVFFFMYRHSAKALLGPPLDLGPFSVCCFDNVI